jgi:hypothetical protein
MGAVIGEGVLLILRVLLILLRVALLLPLLPPPLLLLLMLPLPPLLPPLLLLLPLLAVPFPPDRGTSPTSVVSILNRSIGELVLFPRPSSTGLILLFPSPPLSNSINSSIAIQLSAIKS